MRVVALILAALIGLLGVVIIVGAAASEAGLGPAELLVGCVPLGIAVILIQVSRR